MTKGTTLKTELDFHNAYENLVRDCIETYDDFVVFIHYVLNRAIRELEENNSIHVSRFKDQKQKVELEDNLTQSLKSSFRMAGMNANHDSYHRGHCDLLVTLGPFKWLAEAKLGKGPTYIYGGFQQLTTRYSTARELQKNTAIIIYSYSKDVARQMKNWHRHLESKTHVLSTNWLYDQRFETTHTHEDSGSEIIIRHIPVLLYYEPEK